jgi:hypothetical protein
LEQKNNLIIYTPRTGSTILGEILSFSTGGLNLNEGIVDSLINNYNSSWVPSNPNLQIFIPSLQAINGSEMRRNVLNFNVFHNEKQKRIEKLKQLSNWTIKETCTPHMYNFDFIRECCESKNVNVFMVYRRDLVAQHISFMNVAAGRRKSIYANNEIKVSYTAEFDKKTIMPKTHLLIDCITRWRLFYEMFKDKVTLVCFEDIIQPMNFSSIGIDDSVVKQYNMKYNHLIPTPDNFYDDSDKVWQDAWDLMLRVKWTTNTL